MIRFFGFVILSALFVLDGPMALATRWLPFGPEGGSARSFAADPRNPAHLYLGTANGWIYESKDAGQKWVRLAQLGQRDDLVLDHIQVDRTDSKHLLVGTFALGKTDGGLFVSRDGGTSWTSNRDMSGQSIRSFTSAPSNPAEFIAGTLLGVYRSSDFGEHWALISPEKSVEIHEVESVAVDPVDAKVIYAGTWHLPWKTEDGGEHWKSIKDGLIDDSDVFSIIVDPKDAKVVYASACSGIYKSENAGEKFVKVQGIPSTARRTRVLMQDPQNPDIVLAGTTEGLFRTVDAGKTWSRTTGPEVIVNDLYINPTDHLSILVATDRGGVLSSLDGAATFRPANAGFSARQVVSYTGDFRTAGTMYVGVVNDKEWGGVFESDNGGLSWTQQSSGLGGGDVFSLGQASDGSILAGTGHGIYRLQDSIWKRVAEISAGKGPAEARSRRNRSGVAKRTPRRSASEGETKPGPVAASRPGGHEEGGFDGATFAMARAGDTLFAGTSTGVLESTTAGVTWTRIAKLDPLGEWRFVAAAKGSVLAATSKAAMRSTDGGVNWSEVQLPGAVTQITAAAVDGDGGVWIGGREGVFLSRDGGATWDAPKGLAIRDVNNLYFDEAGDRVLMTTNEYGTIAYGVHLPDQKVSFWDTGWHLRLVRPVGDHLIGATLFDGMVIQPRMVDSAEVK